ncbi:hypothetical protein IE53DRAFT_145080 [Violaceomyces palustris]|uniref:Uncharacterized protein n=1 Tax=Violaceomyces palustris TaxID=1673888 RepID=A0ACD0P6K5_9BASI|nr:hypothetical protein IE53DRAFT_145080 [Violaceomyces palustris]
MATSGSMIASPRGSASRPQDYPVDSEQRTKRSNSGQFGTAMGAIPRYAGRGEDDFVDPYVPTSLGEHLLERTYLEDVVRPLVRTLVRARMSQAHEDTGGNDSQTQLYADLDRVRTELEKAARRASQAERERDDLARRFDAATHPDRGYTRDERPVSPRGTRATEVESGRPQRVDAVNALSHSQSMERMAHEGSKLHASHLKELPYPFEVRPGGSAHAAHLTYENRSRGENAPADVSSHVPLRHEHSFRPSETASPSQHYASGTGLPRPPPNRLPPYQYQESGGLDSERRPPGDRVPLFTSYHELEANASSYAGERGMIEESGRATGGPHAPPARSSSRFQPSDTVSSSVSGSNLALLERETSRSIYGQARGYDTQLYNSQGYQPADTEQDHDFEHPRKHQRVEMNESIQPGNLNPSAIRTPAGSAYTMPAPSESAHPSRKLASTKNRTCSNCAAPHDAKFRRGPNGPGTLCDRCGSRWKKYKENEAQSESRLKSASNNNMPAPLSRAHSGLSPDKAHLGSGSGRIEGAYAPPPRDERSIQRRGSMPENTSSAGTGPSSSRGYDLRFSNGERSAQTSKELASGGVASAEGQSRSGEGLERSGVPSSSSTTHIETARGSGNVANWQERPESSKSDSPDMLVDETK